ncbi:MAG: aminoacetone oxidase family FAD-binding enzyme, partial [Chitinophagales bacterium]|nr:aminoacetone oxidase family FAD-binding enzyme [Chitinophagales bacterium]
VSVSNVQCKLLDSNIATSGSILITHTGLSGPSILKLSAFAAREMNAHNYQFNIEINWISIRLQDAIQVLKNAKQTSPKKNISNLTVFDLPHRLWQSVLVINGIKYEKNVADLSNNDIQNIAQTLTQSKLQVTSKNTNKDEFVTAGGIDLKEVDFKTMESKILDNLFFAGEVLNIDAVTGGFNFQAAWTTGNIAGTSIAERSTNYK